MAAITEGARSPILSLRGIGKRYGAVVAVEDVDLDIYPAEILAICGDNGAGKSSLIKIISGAQEPSAGAIAIRGEPAVFKSPRDALTKGVATIYQDLALAPRLSIAANIFMGAELTRPIALPFLSVLDWRRMRLQAREYLSRLSVSVDDMSRPVETLSGGQRQAVAISRALHWNADVIIMDEPTAALGIKETALVLGLIRKLKADGRTVVLISHDTRDVTMLADRVAIMTGGRKSVDQLVDGLTPDELSHLIANGKREGSKLRDS
jgi:ABC-type sugar transport system ATPase subunit